MKTLPLRAQLVVVIVLVQLYSVGVGLSYWIQTRAYVSLDESSRRELAALARLPRLRDRLRRLDSTTDKYLLMGDVSWLRERLGTLREVHTLTQDLSGLLSDERERDIFKQMERQLTSYLSQQSQWISRKQAGRLSTSEAARIVRREPVLDRVTQSLITMKDANLSALDDRRLAMRRASRLTLLLILATGLAAAGVIVFFLSRYLVGPIRVLQRYALSWSLGREWKAAQPPASPEMTDLFNAMKDMAGHLNKQYEKEQDLVKFKTGLVSMVSHEFNNALGVLNVVSVLLEETEPAGGIAKRGTYYTMLKSNIRALSLTADNLLNMGRLETGRFAINRRMTDIAPVLRETIERLGILSERKGIQVTLALPETPISVNADPEALALVATNLLGNAIKYTPEKGSITIGLRRDPSAPGQICVYFQDSGIGISREEQERIFSPYYRTESGKKAAKGFGVGLALATSVIESHGSALKVESEPGQGSTFSFNLPAG